MWNKLPAGVVRFPSHCMNDSEGDIVVGLPSLIYVIDDPLREGPMLGALFDEVSGIQRFVHRSLDGGPAIDPQSPYMIYR